MIANKIITFIVEFINRFMDFHDFACAIILLFAISSFVYFLSLNRKMNNDIISLTNDVENLSGTTDEKMVILNDIVNSKKNSKEIKNLWKKYYATLLKYGAEGSSIDISSFFNKVTLVDIPTKRKIAEIIPGILIAAGILGTFTGLIVGLNTIDVTNPEAIQSSMLPLLEGLKIGFLTSVLGIGSSLSWNLFDRILLHSIVKSVNNFQVAYEQIFPAESLGSYLIEMIKLQSAQTAAVEQMSTNITEDKTKKSHNLSEEQSFSKLSNAISSSINKNLEPLTLCIFELTNRLSDIASQQQANTQKSAALSNGGKLSNVSLDNLGPALENISQQQTGVKENVDQMLTEFKETKSVQEGIANNLNELNTSVKNMSGNIEEIVGKAMDSSMVELNQNFIESVKDISDKIQDGIKNAFDDEIKKVTLHIDETVDNVQKTVENTAKEFDDLKGSMKNIDNKLGDKILYPSKTKRSDGEFY